MDKTSGERVARTGTIILIAGLAFIGTAFAGAVFFLSEALPVVYSYNSAVIMGETLAPLTTTACRILYLGIMVWIGSLVTNRGVTLLTGIPKTEEEKRQKSRLTESTKSHPPSSNEEIEVKPTKKKDSELETKAFEPEMGVIPLEEIEQQS